MFTPAIRVREILLIPAPPGRLVLRVPLVEIFLQTFCFLDVFELFKVFFFGLQRAMNRVEWYKQKERLVLSLLDVIDGF